MNNILHNTILSKSYDEYLAILYDNLSLMDKPNELGETALHYACYYGLLDKFYLLVNMGANVNCLTESKDNLLHYASYSGADNFLIVELVKYDLLPVAKNILGETALHLSANNQISHYLYLWCMRNKVPVVSLKDNNQYEPIESAYYYQHFVSHNYWVQQYKSLGLTIPEFKNGITMEKKLCEIQSYSEITSS